MHQSLKLAVRFATWRSTNICLPNTLPSTSRWASFLNSKPCSNEQKLYSPRYSFGRAIGLFSAILQTCISHFFSSEHEKEKEKEKTTLVCFQKQNRKYHSIKWLQSEFLRELSCQLIGTNHPRCYQFEFCTWLSMFSSLQHRGYLKSVPIWGFLLIQSYFGESGFALMNSESLIQRELRCPLDSAWYILGE